MKNASDSYLSEALYLKTLVLVIPFKSRTTLDYTQISDHRLH